MRATRWVVVAVLFGGAARGEELRTLYTAAVTREGAEVRCGPSSDPKMYPTNRLRKGDKVEVLKELPDGWLGIRPPAGSFSWVRATAVHPTAGGTTWVVVAGPGERVPVLVGSSVAEQEPTVEGAKVPGGTQLYSKGYQKTGTRGALVQVVPPPSEVRYVRASEVTRTSDTVAGAGSPPAGPAAAPANPLWLRAQQAEQAGRLDDAILLYNQLGREVQNSNHDLAMQAFNRAQALAQRRGPGAEARYATGPARLTSKPGRLIQSGRYVDYRKTYLLEDSQGKPLIYAVAPGGMTLDPYVGRNLELIGTQEYRADLRAYCMTVEQVRLLP